MKLNNKGVTLVELMLSMAISLIVIGAITLFLSSGVKGYTNSSDEVDVQAESQSVLNQIINLVRQGDNVQIDSSNQTLTIYHFAETNIVDDTPIEVIWYNSSNKKLYLYKGKKFSERSSIMSDIDAGTISDDKLFGERIESVEYKTNGTKTDRFVYDLHNKESKVLQIHMKFAKGNSIYNADGKAEIRSRIVNIP